MTTNSFQVIDMVTLEALEVLKTKLAFGNRCNRQFDDQFGDVGAKIGDTLRIKLPPRYTVGTGPAPTLQNFQQNQRPVAAQTQVNVALEITSKDLSLSMESLSDSLLDPAMAQLASSIDGYGTAAITGYSIATGEYAGNYAGFQNLVTPGNVSLTTGPAAWTGATLNQSAPTATNPAQTALAIFFASQARLTSQAAAPMDRFGVLSPDAAANSLSASIGLFNPQVQIGKQFEEGVLGKQAGAEWMESQNTPVFTSGAWTQSASCQVSTTSTSGDTTLVVKGFGASDTINAGDQFVVTNVFEAGPLTRVSTGKLQVFTAIAAPVNNGSGGFTISVNPPIVNSGQYQTVTALPQANALITMMGTSNTSTQVNFVYHKDAVTFVSAPLTDESEYGAKCSIAKDPEDGLAIRYINQYVATAGQRVSAVDALIGWAVSRPELGARIQA